MTKKEKKERLLQIVERFKEIYPEDAMALNTSIMIRLIKKELLS